MIGNLSAAIFTPGAVLGDYESIATSTVGAGGASSITFSSIPSTYQHLQLRVLAITNRASYADDLEIEFNGDTGTNYYQGHRLAGDGSSASSSAYGTAAYIVAGRATGNTSSTTLGVSIIDILDYRSTNKHKTVRYLGGMENNSNGEAMLGSGLWFPSTIAAITSIKITPGVGTSFSNLSHFALYGIKG